MIDFSKTKVILNTHRSSPTHGDEIKQYFINQKCAGLWFIAHEFAQLQTRRTFIETYANGKLLSKKYGPDFSFLPEYLVYVKDILTSIWLILTQIRRADVYVGISAYDTLPGIICKNIVRLKSIVFLTIDFVPKRFPQAILNKIYVMIDKFCINHATQTWNPSPRMAEGREKIWGYEPSLRQKQTEMPFGIWLNDNFKPGLKAKNPLMIFSGHLVAKQGVQLAIKSLSIILRTLPKTKLIIIGTGEYLLELQKIVKKLNLSSHVSFTGYIDSKSQSRLFAKAWIGLATFDPQLDTFSYYADPGKIKLYLGHGLPVLLTDVPYIAKIVHQAKAGRIVKYDEQDFATAAIELLSNSQRYRQYSENALKLATNYDWNRTLATRLASLI